MDRTLFALSLGLAGLALLPGIARAAPPSAPCVLPAPANPA